MEVTTAMSMIPRSEALRPIALLRAMMRTKPSFDLQVLIVRYVPSEMTGAVAQAEVDPWEIQARPGVAVIEMN